MTHPNWKTNSMAHQSASSLATTSPVLPIAAVAFAIAIFVVDTFTLLDIAIAVLYVRRRADGRQCFSAARRSGCVGGMPGTDRVELPAVARLQRQHRSCQMRGEPLGDRNHHYPRIEESIGHRGAARAGSTPRTHARRRVRTRHERRDHLLEPGSSRALRMDEEAGGRQGRSRTLADGVPGAARFDQGGAAPHGTLGRRASSHQTRRDAGHGVEPVVLAAGRARATDRRYWRPIPTSPSAIRRRERCTRRKRSSRT